MSRVDDTRGVWKAPANEVVRGVLDVELPDISGLEVLQRIKADPSLQAMELIRQSRLSVAPVREVEWKRIIAMADRPAREAH